MITFLVLTFALVLTYSLAGYMFNIHYGYTGLINLGIAGFFAIGAYTTAILTTPPTETRFAGETYKVGFGMPVWLGVLAAAVVAALVALIVGVIALRSVSGEHLAIMTLGFSEIIRFVAINESWLTRGPMGIMGIPRPFSSVWQGIPYILILLGTLLAVYVICERLRTSPLGRVLRGIRADDLAVESLGKNVLNFRLVSFTAGALFGGMAGAFWAHFSGAIQPQDFSPTLTFLIATSVIVGGEGNNKGVLIGTATVVGLLYQAPRFLPKIGDAWTIPSARFIVIGLLIILILRFRREGIVPKKLVQVEQEAS